MGNPTCFGCGAIEGAAGPKPPTTPGADFFQGRSCFCCIGVYSIHNQPFDALATGAMVAIGIFLLRTASSGRQC